MENNASLFERIGGMNAVNASVEIFYAKVLTDDGINHFFANTNMTAQSGKMKAFLAMAFGAPMAGYSGKKMREAHAHMNITEAHFGLVAGHLVATLQELGVAQNLIDEVVAIAVSTKDDVLGN
ncbi:MAG: group 1 truncated hemoglobin [Phycisphaerae bacterium]|nr:group 1 truncated hemoglobin [Saprospiraceae bacterium]